jgi:hypothetical protein
MVEEPAYEVLDLLDLHWVLGFRRELVVHDEGLTPRQSEMRDLGLMAPSLVRKTSRLQNAVISLRDRAAGSLPPSSRCKRKLSDSLATALTRVRTALATALPPAPW